MLQINAGSMWIGTKVMERIREESQSSKRQNFLVKITQDKVSNKKCIQIIIEKRQANEMTSLFNILFAYL